MSSTSVRGIALAAAVGGLVLGSTALSGCAAGGDYYRRSWVDPATAPDQAKYITDLEECRLLAKAVFDESRDKARASRTDRFGATAIGVVTGSIAAGPAGAIIGGSAGMTAVDTDGLRHHLDVLDTANRECLRGRGYATLR